MYVYIYNKKYNIKVIYIYIYITLIFKQELQKFSFFEIFKINISVDEIIKVQQNNIIPADEGCA